MFPFPRPFWDGHRHSEGLHPDYVNLRKRLFKAAQDSDWVAVFAIIAEDKQGKAVNGVLLNADSHYSVLHHAAAGNAPLEVVERLVASGAFRSVRCALGERPIDVADRLGHTALLGLLEPELKHSLKAELIHALQDTFRELILREGLSPVRKMRLPQLEPLLEQDDPVMTFEIPFGVFVYKLQKLEFPISDTWNQEEHVLLVRSYQRMGEGIESHYVVTAHGTQLVSRRD